MKAGLFQYLFLPCLLMVLPAVSCKKSKCAKSTGAQTTEVRNLEVFTSINVHDKINIELKRSTVNRASITCGKNLMDYIVTRQEGTVLEIRNDNSCNFLRSYKKPVNILLEYTSLDHINFIGAGTVSSTDTLIQPSLFIEGEGSSGDFDLLVKMDSLRMVLHTGNSNVKLRGKCKQFSFYSGGTTIIDSRQLEAVSCLCNNSGSGDFYVKALLYLYAEIHQQGSIYYTGNPASVEQRNSGRGTLKAL